MTTPMGCSRSSLFSRPMTTLTTGESGAWSRVAWASRPSSTASTKPARASPVGELLLGEQVPQTVHVVVHPARALLLAEYVHRRVDQLLLEGGEGRVPRVDLFPREAAHQVRDPVGVGVQIPVVEGLAEGDELPPQPSLVEHDDEQGLEVLEGGRGGPA